MIWSLCNLVPLVTVILGAFKTTAEIYLGPFVLPETWNFTNFRTAFQKANVLNGIFNSALYGVLSVIFIILLSTMAGHSDVIVRMCSAYPKRTSSANSMPPIVT